MLIRRQTIANSWYTGFFYLKYCNRSNYTPMNSVTRTAYICLFNKQWISTSRLDDIHNTIVLFGIITFIIKSQTLDVRKNGSVHRRSISKFFLRATPPPPAAGLSKGCFSVSKASWQTFINKMSELNTWKNWVQVLANSITSRMYGLRLLT